LTALCPDPCSALTPLCSERLNTAGAAAEEAEREVAAKLEEISAAKEPLIDAREARNTADKKVAAAGVAVRRAQAALDRFEAEVSARDKRSERLQYEQALQAAIDAERIAAGKVTAGEAALADATREEEDTRAAADAAAADAERARAAATGARRLLADHSSSLKSQEAQILGRRREFDVVKAKGRAALLAAAKADDGLGPLRRQPRVRARGQRARVGARREGSGVSCVRDCGWAMPCGALGRADAATAAPCIA
jgi:hypothetical protein